MVNHVVNQIVNHMVDHVVDYICIGDTHGVTDKKIESIRYSEPIVIQLWSCSWVVHEEVWRVHKYTSKHTKQLVERERLQGVFYSVQQTKYIKMILNVFILPSFWHVCMSMCITFNRNPIMLLKFWMFFSFWCDAKSCQIGIFLHFIRQIYE